MAVLTCNKCDKKFTQASSLSRHKSSHTEANMVTCELCGKPCRKYHLKSHTTSCKKVEIKDLFGETIFKCDICRMEFDKEQNLKQHSKGHIEKSCSLCEKKFHPRSMKKHIETVHTYNIFIVPEEEKVLPDNEIVIDLTHEIVEDILKTIISPIGNYFVKNLESEAHGEKELKLVLHINSYNL